MSMYCVLHAPPYYVCTCNYILYIWPYVPHPTFLSLCCIQDSRNVLRAPPPGIQFHFDFAKSYPVALSLLKEDSRLQALRFELVPKK